MWHPEILGEQAARTLRDLERDSLLEGFYLAGGTGLALHLGHRVSRDLDFFSPGLFSEEKLIEKIRHARDFSLLARSAQTLHAEIQRTKVSFLGYAYPLLFPLFDFRGAGVADPRDIACMKISAIASRGTKRDFVDLYATARQYGLADLLTLFSRKFAGVEYSRVHLFKSLTYFEDAEQDPMPDMRAPLVWDDVKGFFAQELPRLLLWTDR